MERSINRIWLFAFLLLFISVLYSCSDSTLFSGNKRNGIQVNTATKGQKQVLQKPLYTFIDKQNISRQLKGKQNKHLSAIQNRPTTINIKMARLAINASYMLKEKQTVVLPIASGEIISANSAKVNHLLDSVVYWHGLLQNSHGFANLILTKYGLSGIIKTDSSAYEIETFGNGIEAIIQINENKGARGIDATPILLNANRLDSLKSAIKLSFTRNEKRKKATRPNGLNSDPYIDVLVVYTPAVANTEGSNLTNLIQTAIISTNQAYNNSNIYVNLRLVHASEVNYDESGHSYDEVLDAMKSPSDGKMDNIQSLRNQYLADIVVLIDSLTPPAGNGYVTVGEAYLGPNETAAFAALDYGYIGYFGGYTFAHETGHLYGAHHNLGSDQSGHPNTPYTFQHGYIGSNNIWHTIMAYESDCNNCPAIQYYSNPNVNYSGYPGYGDPVGEEEVANNARVINFTKYTLRNFRALSSPSDFTLTNRYHVGEHPHFTWTKNPEASAYAMYRCITTNPGGLFGGCQNKDTWQMIWYGPYPPGTLAQWTDIRVTMTTLTKTTQQLFTL